jgi:uncharacterized lipoprotein YmbA
LPCLLVVVGLLGCATTPSASFYALSPNPVDPVARLPDLVIAIGPVDLPRYLDRPQIVSRAGGNRLDVDDFNRWGGALDEEITRVLAIELGRALATDQVFAYPSRLASSTDYRVALDIRSFDGPRDGAVELVLAWSLIADRSGEILQTAQASYKADVAGEGVEAYVQAMARALGALSRDLAERIAEQRGR